jgi:predicted pyridoxine 5'-phosphate oxidase superfamily flavin-nucleotide-binding protein
MGRKFAEIAFTDSVKAVQARHGSRRTNEALERARNPRDRLTPVETAFIQERDSFYQATVSETGWPYVQFRGGPKGFLKVLNALTLAYADFRGNIQYLSAGNIAEEERVALILMDYARRQRLKIWARAAVVDLDDEPDLVRHLAEPGYPARIERAVVMRVAAVDWNCPQHITPRFTRAEIDQGLAGALGRRDPANACGSCDPASDLGVPGRLDLSPGRSFHHS